MNIKVNLRKKYKDLRHGTENKSQKSRDISKILFESEIYKNADSVFAYSSIFDEVSTDEIIDRALIDGKKVALPLCLDDKGSMEFYFIKGKESLKSGMYGIMEPVKEKCEKAEFSEKTICTVPGLSFDKNGYRLGYGKGYYDRFLKNFEGKSIGLSYEECLAEDLPAGKFDICVNYLITNKKLYDYSFKEDK